MNKFKAVLLDLDNTLYEYDKCNEAAIESSINKLAGIFAKSKAEIKEIFEKSREKVKSQLKDTAASHSRLLYLQKTIEALKGRTDSALTHEIHDFFWQEYLNEMKLYDGVSDFLEYTKQKKIQLAIVSDLTADIQLKKIIKLGLNNHIDFVVTSEESGMDKPHPSIFSLALEKLRVPKDEVVMIGDDIKDAKGAEKAGIKCIMVKEGNFRAAFESFKTLSSQ